MMMMMMMRMMMLMMVMMMMMMMVVVVVVMMMMMMMMMMMSGEGPTWFSRAGPCQASPQGVDPALGGSGGPFVRHSWPGCS